MPAARCPAIGRPKLLTALHGYTRRTAVADVTAGVTVAARGTHRACDDGRDARRQNLLQTAKQILNRRLIGVRSLLWKLEHESAVRV